MWIDDRAELAEEANRLRQADDIQAELVARQKSVRARLFPSAARMVSEPVKPASEARRRPSARPVEAPAWTGERLPWRAPRLRREALPYVPKKLALHQRLPVPKAGTRTTKHDLIEHPPTITFVLAKVAVVFGLPVRMMKSHKRISNEVRPRQAAMYLCNKLTNRSLPEIGRRMGNKDHTTVLHAIFKVPILAQYDSDFAERLAAAEEAINERGLPK